MGIIYPLFNFLAEDVSIRAPSNLVEEAKVLPMKGTRNVQVPTHTLYVDDIMFFFAEVILNTSRPLVLFWTGMTFAMSSCAMLRNLLCIHVLFLKA